MKNNVFEALRLLGIHVKDVNKGDQECKWV